MPVWSASSSGRGHAGAVGEQRVGRQHRGAVEQRRPQLLALTGAALAVQRGEAADHRQHRVGGVGHAEADVQRLVARAHRTGFVLEPGRGLEQRVETAEVRERTVEPVRPGVAVDDVGIDALAVFVRDPEPLGDAGSHVVMHDVGPGDELERDLLARLGLDVEADVALAARAAHERLVHHAHAVAGDRLDLDHVRAEVAEDHRSERPREVLAEVDDDDAFERVHQLHLLRGREPAYVVGRVAERAEDLVVVLPGLRARPLDATRRVVHVDRDAHLRGLAVHRVVDRRDHVVGHELRVRRAVRAERGFHRVDRLDRVVVGAELLDEPFALARLVPGASQRCDLRALLGARASGSATGPTRRARRRSRPGS